VMDGKEFEVVADVVSLLLTPGPSITTITAEEKLLGEGENEEVEDARQLFATVRQDLRGLRQEAREVQKCLGMTLQRSTGGTALQRGAELHAFTVVAPPAAAAAAAAAASTSTVVPAAVPASPGGTTTATAINDVSVTASADLLPVMTAMREHLAGEALSIATSAAADAGHLGGASGGASVGPSVGPSVHFSTSQPGSPGPSTPSARANQHQNAVMASGLQRRQSTDARRDQLTLLLRWVQEQESTVAEAYSSTKLKLRELKTAAGKQQVSRAASRVLVQLDRIVWQLCTPEKTPFVQAALRGLTFDTHRNRDHSGSAKFIIHRVDIIDATGNLNEGPATPPGVILACWNPDASYEREPVLRIVTTMGVPTRTHTVFEHLDASLHPLSLHLTESIAVACWEYFFPKEDSKSRQEAFSQSVGNSTTASNAPGGSNAGGGRGRRGSTLAAMDAAAVQAGGESPMAAGSSSAVFGTSPLASGRSSFSDYPGSPPPTLGGGGGSNPGSRGQSGIGGGVQRSLLLGDEDAALYGGPSGGSTPSASASAVAASRGPFRASGTAAGTALASTGTGGGSKKDKNQQQHGGRTRKRFVYVKLNRAHMRITYQGYPIGIKDRILVINSYTCENLDGRWRDLLANVKQKAILSAVWSGLGLQGRKIRELMDGAAPAVPSHQSGLPGEDGRGAKGLLAKMGLAPKSRKGEGAVPGQPEMSQEELKALSKKRALFGNHVIRNMGGNSGGGGPLRAGISAAAAATAAADVASTSAAATTTATATEAVVGDKGGSKSAGSSPAGSSGSTPRFASSTPPEKSPEKQQHGSPPANKTSAAATTTSAQPSTTTANPPSTSAGAAALTIQQRLAVPVLDLQRPLPPEDPADALDSQHNSREPSLSPLEAGIVLSTTGTGTASSNIGIRTTLLGGSPGRSPRSASASPSKKFLIGRAESGGGNSLTAVGSGGGGTSGSNADPVSALLGQAFHQQQTQHVQHGSQHKDDPAAQLLGHPSPRKEGSSGGAGKSAKAWLSNKINKMNNH
jgi:hypothetical protein